MKARDIEPSGPFEEVFDGYVCGCRSSWEIRNASEGRVHGPERGLCSVRCGRLQGLRVRSNSYRDDPATPTRFSERVSRLLESFSLPIDSVGCVLTTDVEHPSFLDSIPANRYPYDPFPHAISNLDLSLVDALVREYSDPQYGTRYHATWSFEHYSEHLDLFGEYYLGFPYGVALVAAHDWKSISDDLETVISATVGESSSDDPRWHLVDAMYERGLVLIEQRVVAEGPMTWRGLSVIGVEPRIR